MAGCRRAILNHCSPEWTTLSAAESARIELDQWGAVFSPWCANRLKSLNITAVCNAGLHIFAPAQTAEMAYFSHFRA
jgi:hypothetical protein